MCVWGRVCRKMILTFLITNQLNAGDGSKIKTCGTKKSMTLLTKHASVKNVFFFVFGRGLEDNIEKTSSLPSHQVTKMLLGGAKDRISTKILSVIIYWLMGEIPAP